MRSHVRHSLRVVRDVMPSQGISIFILVFFIFFAVFISPLFFWKFFHIDLIVSDAKAIADEFAFLYYVLITTITAIIALFTYKQFNHFNENLHAEYLLKIDERWGSVEIMKARSILHVLYLKAREAISAEVGQSDTTDQMLQLEMGKMIIEL